MIRRLVRVALCALAAAFLLTLVAAATAGRSDLVVLGTPCSQVAALQLEKQLNFHAYLVLKGCAGSSLKPAAPVESEPASPSRGAPAPAAVGASDRDVIDPLDASVPHDVQSESMVAANGNTI